MSTPDFPSDIAEMRARLSVQVERKKRTLSTEEWARQQAEAL